MFFHPLKGNGCSLSFVRDGIPEMYLPTQKKIQCLQFRLSTSRHSLHFLSEVYLLQLGMHNRYLLSAVRFLTAF